MITINELFSGIGAQVAALKRLGIDYKVVGISEIDKYAIKSYEAINGATYNYGDITKIESLDYADLWTYSFPCQDLSVAGKQSGIKEGTRSGLLLHVERLLTESVLSGKQPKYLLLENVKALVGKKFKSDFDRWLDKLEQLGYNNYWKVLNAKDYGIPQNRERVFVVSIRKDVDTEGYVFPSPLKLEKRLKDMLEPYVEEKYYLSDEKVGKFSESLKDKEISNTILCGGGSLDGKHTWDIVAEPKVINPLKGKTNYGWHFEQAVYDENGIARTVKAGEGSGNIPKIIQKPHGFNKGGFHENAPTITSNGSYQENNFVVKQVASLTDKNHQADRVYSADGLCPTLTTMATGGNLQPKVIEKGIGHNPVSKKFEFNGFHENKPCPTLLATDYKCPKCYSDGYRIRKLTPKECWRLMGFTDDEFEKAKNAGVSNTQLYKQAGNSIVVNVLESIFMKIFYPEKVIYDKDGQMLLF